MKKYMVYGYTEVTIGIEVEANSEEEALELAAMEFGGVSNYAGNGGTDKLIGVSGNNEFIECDSDVEFTQAQEAE